MAEAATLDTQPALTPMTMRDRYVGLMQSYAALRGKPTPELLVRIADFQQQVAGLGTRLAGSDARFEAQATINYWQTVRINAGERPDTILLADFDQEAARREAAGKPPYKGLAPYQRADSSFFVSRFKLVNDLTDMVKSKRLLALVGFSGSGKSSVVRAGLIPNLEGRAYDGIDDNGLTDSSTWAYPPPILPGADPVAALEARFKCTITAPADLVAALDAMNTAVLLTIDQFEEVFTLSDPGPRRTLFLDSLVAAATTGAHRHVVVITMRKEYEGKITAHEAFNKLFTDDACREVKPMQPSELRKVIEEPAQRLGVGFEPKLVEELLAQVQGEPAGLPLLSFTLLKLWDKRAGVGDMKWADYETLGGSPRDILAKSADDVYLGFNAQQDRDLVQGIFTLLAKIGDGFEATSNRVKRSELGILVNQDSEGGAIDAVLDRLATAGLIRMAPIGPMTPTTDIEVAHEALIRNWGRLTGWVKERFAQQTTRKAFTLRAEKWKERGRHNVDMLSGVSLDEAREFPDQSKVEEAYIAASLRHSRIRQWRVWALTILFATLSGGLWLKTGQLNELREIDKADNRLPTLVAQYDQLIGRGDTELAKKILALGLRDGAEPPPAMKAALAAAHLNKPGITELKPIGAKGAKGLSIAGEGTALMSLWGDGKARLWRRAPGEQKWTGEPMVLALPGRRITAIALSPDATRAISSSVAEDGPQIEIWTLAPGGTVKPPRIRRDEMHMAASDQEGFVSVKFDPAGAGKRAILAGNGFALVIDGFSGDVLQALDGGGNPTSVAIFSPKGDRILLADTGGLVQIFDSTSRMPKTEALRSDYVGQGGEEVTSARFTDTGARYAVGTKKGNVYVYSAADGETIMTLPGPAKGVSSVTFSPDSALIASGSDDGSVRLWEHGITSGRLLRTLAMAPPGAKVRPVTAVAFKAGVDQLAVATSDDADGAISLIDFNGDKLNKERGPIDVNAYIMGLSRNRRVVVTATEARDKATGGTETKIDVRRVDADTPMMSVAGMGLIYDSLISPDGRVLALVHNTAGADFLDVYSTSTGKQLARIELPRLPYKIEGMKPADWPLFPQVPLATEIAGDGKRIVMAMPSGRLMAWAGGNAILPLAAAPRFEQGDASPLVAMTGGSARFALAQPTGAISIHDGADGKVIRSIKAAGKVSTMRFSPDGARLFIGFDTGAGAIHDVATGKVTRLDGRHDNGITFQSFSADGEKLITASSDGAARVWKTRTGALINVFASPQGARSASLSPDGTRVITGSDSRIATLWDVATGKPLTTLPGPMKSGFNFAWFIDNDYAMTLSGNTVRRRWDIRVPEVTKKTLIDEACKDGGRFSEDERRRNGIDESSVPICRIAGQSSAGGRLSDEMIEKLRLRR